MSDPQAQDQQVQPQAPQDRPHVFLPVRQKADSYNAYHVNVLLDHLRTSPALRELNVSVQTGATNEALALTAQLVNQTMQYTCKTAVACMPKKRSRLNAKHLQSALMSIRCDLTERLIDHAQKCLSRFNQFERGDDSNPDRINFVKQILHCKQSGRFVRDCVRNQCGFRLGYSRDRDRQIETRVGCSQPNSVFLASAMEYLAMIILQASLRSTFAHRRVVMNEFDVAYTFSTHPLFSQLFATLDDMSSFPLLGSFVAPDRSRPSKLRTDGPNGTCAGERALVGQAAHREVAYLQNTITPSSTFFNATTFDRLLREPLKQQNKKLRRKASHIVQQAVEARLVKLIQAAVRISSTKTLMADDIIKAAHVNPTLIPMYNDN